MYLGAVPRHAYIDELVGDGFALKLSNHVYNIFLPVAVNK